MGYKKPVQGVMYFMFEQAMKKKLSSYLKEIEEETKNLQKEFKDDIKNLIKETKQLNRKFSSLLKICDKEDLKKFIQSKKKESEDE
jgi:hypothetical protein